MNAILDENPKKLHVSYAKELMSMPKQVNFPILNVDLNFLIFTIKSAMLLFVKYFYFFQHSKVNLVLRDL